MRMSEQQLRNLLMEFDVYTTWIVWQMVSLCKSDCVDREMAQRVLGCVPQMFGVYNFYTVHYHGPRGGDGFASFELVLGDEEQRVPVCVYFNGKLVNGLMSGCGYRLRFRPTDHDCANVRGDNVLDLMEVAARPGSDYYSGEFVDGMNEHGIFCDDETLQCFTPGCKFHVRKESDNLLEFNGKIISEEPVLNVPALLIYVAMEYMCDVHRDKTSDLIHVVPNELTRLQSILTRGDVKFLTPLLLKEESEEGWISLVHAFVHIKAHKLSSPFLGGTYVDKYLSVDDDALAFVENHLAAYHHEYCFGMLWWNNAFQRWKRRAVNSRLSRQRDAELSVLLCRHRASRRMSMLQACFSKLLRHSIEHACMSRVFSAWHAKSDDQRRVKRSAFLVWKQAMFRGVSVRSIIARRFSLSAPPQRHWYDFPCVFVRAYPRDQWGVLEKNLFPGYVPNRNRGHWWPLVGK